jgi:hypothetical protein
MAVAKVISNVEYAKELALQKRIKTEQNFGIQTYANFKSLRFGIDSCCYTDFQSSILDKEICDWIYSKSTKVVIATNEPGIFIEPLVKINLKASVTCPATPTNVCTVLDLEDILVDKRTFTRCFEVASDLWTITHNLGSYPSVTVVDSGNTVVIGEVDYTNANILTITFSAAFSGCAFLN